MRIVSRLPSVTEIVFALGLGDASVHAGASLSTLAEAGTQSWRRFR